MVAGGGNMPAVQWAVVSVVKLVVLATNAGSFGAGSVKGAGCVAVTCCSASGSWGGGEYGDCRGAETWYCREFRGTLATL